MRKTLILRRASFISLLLTAASIALAGMPSTQAWRRIFSDSTYDQFSGAPATDASGYAYFTYLDHQGLNHFVHFVKIGPAENVVFDKSVNGFVDYIPMRTYVSPFIAGKQYVYITGEVDHNGDKWIYVRKFDTAGTDQWGAFVSFGSQTGYDDLLVGFYADASNNALLVADQVDGGVHHARFIELDATGTVISDSSNADIQPEKAAFNPVVLTTGRWLVSGVDVNNVRPYSARFGGFNPATGHFDFGETVDGFYSSSTGLTIKRHYNFTLMHSGNCMVFRDTTTWASSVSQPSSTYYVEFSNSTFTGGYWQFPTSGPEAPGIATMADQYTSSGPIYLVGHTDSAGVMPFLEQYTSTGTRNWRHGGQPTDQIFITPEGFYSTYFQGSTQALFLEHFDTASTSYDFGKSYPGNGAAPPTFGGIAFFQNFYYVNVNFPTNTNGYDVFVDRFVTGICMQSISCLSTVKGGQTLAVTIHLNGNAPTGGLSVGLNSSTAKLLMPNGTHAQLFTVPAGQPSLTVNLNAQAVSSNTSATLLAIQNGIRRFAAATVTP